jgi:dipeptidyl aminopeptidase/acylaminoacyl peptidase
MSEEFAFTWSCSQSPSGIYSYDLATGRRTEWVKPRRGDRETRSAEEAVLIRYPTFDGRQIPAFVRRPASRSRGPCAVLIDIHGGPDSQARPGFSTIADFILNELGIALVWPNVRGSSGYGRAYKSLDDLMRREDAVRDIGALLDWIATQPDLDASRVAVSGSSYGGYLALAAMVQYGDRLRAGIDVSGVSDFQIDLTDALPTAIEGWSGEYGDERDLETRRFFQRISPLANAGKIRKPLLVIHGANDPRVKLEEAERIVQAVRNNGVPVWYVRFDGEGHSFLKREHGLYSQHAQILFLSEFLIPKG